MAEVSFGEWLKRRRKAEGMTQEQLAVQVSCSTINLRKIESEERRPSAQIVERLAEIFNISQDEQATFLRFARGDWKSAPQEMIDGTPWRRSSTVPPANLPISLSSLIGREQDVALLYEYLSRTDIRLVTLIGPPGIGKTRLSLEAARKALPDFLDGVYFVEFAPLDDIALIASTVAQTLGYVGVKNLSANEQLREGIGDKQMLLVLDNCEHLIEGIASLASDLLSSCSQLKILTTSRESLRIPGEWQYLVPALNGPNENSMMDIATASAFPALTLFVERARAVRSDFTLNADNLQPVASICAQLDGLPLAIELIAARVRLMSPQSLLAKMNDQFVLSADGMRALSTRQKTLNNAIDWSYNLLSHEEQNLFGRLSVFSGGFTLEAAEAIFSRTITEKSVPDLVASLLDKSLLQRTVEAEARGENRFSMLVTIQKFALDRLRDMGEESEVRQWHFDYFLRLAEVGEPHMSGRGQLEWLPRLQAEMDNFRAAFEWNLARQSDTEKSLRLANALLPFWRIRSDYHEAQHWLGILLNLQEVEHFPEAYARAMLNLGTLKLIYVDAKAAEPLLLQCILLARTLEDNRILAEALDFLGLTYSFQTKFEQAHTLLEESQSIFRATNDRKGLALTNWHLGWLVGAEGHNTAAFGFFNQALILFQEVGDIFRQSILFRSIGRYLVESGEWQQGNGMLRQALSAAHLVGSKLEMGTAFWGLSAAEEQQNNLRKAAQLLWTAQKLYRACGAQSNITDVEQELERLRLHLDQATLEAAIEQAQTWTIEQAIAYALE